MLVCKLGPKKLIDNAFQDILQLFRIMHNATRDCILLTSRRYVISSLVKYHFHP